MLNIALIGASGVGKGTHAAALVRQHELQHLVIGDLLRQELDRHSAVGFLAEQHISLGQLVPDDIVDAVVAERIWHGDAEKGILFDGFPRTVDQARFLDELFAERNRRLDGVVYLRIADDAVEDRLLGRLICGNCHTPFHIAFRPPQQEGVCDVCGGPLKPREDDIREMIRVRLRAFRRALDPVLHYYSDTGRLQIIDGDESLEAVSDAIDQAVTALEDGTAKNSPNQQFLPSAASTPVRIRPLGSEDARHRSFDLVLVGGPGSGKGTQAEQLQMHLGLLHIASGDLFRDNLANKTDLGKLARTYMDRGDLVPDDVTEAMVEERITRSDAEDGFILDGFPRTAAQAQALSEIMNASRRRLDGVIYIQVSDEEIVRRLSGRLICRSCQNSYHVQFKPPVKEGLCDSCEGDLYQRDDDNPNTVNARLKTFHSQTSPIISYYRDAGILVEIDGEGKVPDVTARTLAAADKLKEAVH